MRVERVSAATLGLAVMMVSACGDGAPSPSHPTSPTPPALAGTVIDRATRLGVPGARVEVVEGPNAGRAATTDALGGFRLEALGEGDFAVQVTHRLYQDERQSIRSGSAPALIVRPRPCDTPACGAPTECNRVMAILRKPFDGEYFTSNQFDHDTPRGFGSENGNFVSSCGRAATYDGHNGYDWVMREGTPILAAAPGTVSFAGQENIFLCPFLGRRVSGTLVTIRHVGPTGETFWSQYLHLSAMAVTEGQSVDAGQVIGASGNTGCSSGPHLHFSVFREFGNAANGLHPTDPYGWQGPGEDPWAANANGAFSAWLWATAPSITSSGGARIREVHATGTAALGIDR